MAQGAHPTHQAILTIVTCYDPHSGHPEQVAPSPHRFFGESSLNLLLSTFFSAARLISLRNFLCDINQ